MIKQAVERFDASRDALLAKYSSKHPGNYLEIVKDVISAITDEDYSDFSPDPERITEIDHGDYQGTLVYVIGAKGYQPSDYWCVFVGYGSCSGCDTLQSIRHYDDDPPTPGQAKDYLTLALHIVQGIKPMGVEE